jgi:hypothetical protein
MELNPELDLAINVDNLTVEFKEFSLKLYRYYQYKAKIETQRDMAKALLKEVKATVYKRLKSDPKNKHTEKSLEAEIDTDLEVMEAQRKFIRAEHDASTWSGAVDSMKAKKDMLMQLGADARKEK